MAAEKVRAQNETQDGLTGAIHQKNSNREQPRVIQDFRHNRYMQGRPQDGFVPCGIPIKTGGYPLGDVLSFAPNRRPESVTATQSRAR